MPQHHHRPTRPKRALALWIALTCFAAPTLGYANDTDGDGFDDDVDTCLLIPNPFAPGWIEGQRFDARSGNTTTLGDIDKDGDLDAVVVGSRDYDALLRINQGDGTFSHTSLGTFGGYSGGFAHIGDINGDTHNDIVIATDHASEVRIGLGGGDGTVAAWTAHDPNTHNELYIDTLAVGDMDSDGDLDLVTSTTSHVVLHRNDGTGAFTIEPYPLAEWRASNTNTALADVDNDGDLDVFIGSPNAILLHNRGDGVLEEASDTGLDPAYNVLGSVTAFGDMNGDGHPDLVAGDGPIQFNNGDGTFTPGTTRYPNFRALTDFDNDGDLDAILLGTVADPSANVWINDGTGLLSPSDAAWLLPGAADRQTVRVAAGDVNGDGYSDLIVEGHGVGQVLLNQVQPTITRDDDNDGVSDCIDACPDDPNKAEPGRCGCGVPDDDSDSDGIRDCEDACPEDPDKTAPGSCGCGVPDEDLDQDAVLDCEDVCPDVPNPDQIDTNGDGVGDACTPEPPAPPPSDRDDDGVPDADDNCPDVPNPAQTDQDANGIGDACDLSDLFDREPDDDTPLPSTPNRAAASPSRDACCAVAPAAPPRTPAMLPALLGLLALACALRRRR